MSIKGEALFLIVDLGVIGLHSFGKVGNHNVPVGFGKKTEVKQIWLSLDF